MTNKLPFSDGHLSPEDLATSGAARKLSDLEYRELMESVRDDIYGWILGDSDESIRDGLSLLALSNLGD